MSFRGRADYKHGSLQRLGVLLINLGTPATPTPSGVRQYLRKFLSDPRVVEIPRLIWYPILYLFILPFRPVRVSKLYKKIWLKEGSPLLVNTLKQAQKLSQQLNKEGVSDITVKAAMCYSQPDITQMIEALHRENITKLLILPLYPQYSATTTAAAFDIVCKVLKRYRWLPEIRTIFSYHNDPSYIEACAEQIRQFHKQHPQPEKLLLSFHGLPKANLLKGDPYYCYCHASARLIAEALNLSEDEWLLCFQSRFGRAEWLKPATDEVLRKLPTQNIKNINVFCPGFAADCLETLEEIAIQNKELFINAGGENFHYIPALNDADIHIKCLANLVKQQTANW